MSEISSFVKLISKNFILVPFIGWKKIKIILEFNLFDILFQSLDSIQVRLPPFGSAQDFSDIGSIRVDILTATLHFHTRTMKPQNGKIDKCTIAICLKEKS